MSDIKFNCPHCHKKLGVPDSVLGSTISCPLCKGHIGLPAAKTPKADAQPPQASGGLRVIGIGLQKQATDIKFSCPTCDVHIVISEKAAGKHITCQRCNSKILVPARQQEAQSAPAASAPTPAAPEPPPPVIPPLAKPAAPGEAIDEADPRNIPALIERLRGGDTQVGRALIRFGESVIPALIEGFRENTLEEPDNNPGADHIVSLLAKCGGICVHHLVAKLGKCRHAYYALGKIGNEEALNALSRELTSVNWHRVEVACKALAMVETPSVQKLIPNIETVRKSTRVGEVYLAAGNTLTALQARFPKVQASGTALPQAKVVRPNVIGPQVKLPSPIGSHA